MNKQWGKTSQQSDSSFPVPEALCKRCGKPPRSADRGSMTGWVFGQQICQCTINYRLTHLPKFGEAGDQVSGSERSGLISDRYSLDTLIARGGMGKVYKAIDQHLEKECVIKILRSESIDEESKVERFYKEARSCARLDHPNIVSVIDSGITQSGLPFIVMDYVRGVSFRELLDSREKLQLIEYLDLFQQLCTALTYIHDRGIIHRDIKPDNLIISSDSEGKDRPTRQKQSTERTAFS